ncbi:cutinase family protein [Cryptosporangium arvum]|uniref:cutinase family protein n=1 Tax=Cryptosporangium arvum TaxID=80871 RepID=UPI0004B436B2|nr:cutinase family protein [Cryptosporangium arvum]
MSALSPHTWRLRALAVVALLAAVVLTGGPAPAIAGNPGCGEVAVVFARGSGQHLAQRESAVFLRALSERLGDAVRATAYELGSAAYGGARYPAVGVGVDSSDAFANLLDAGAFWTGNEGHRYRASVAAGVTELRAYLAQRVRTCPTERLVLGGYSQGAQVVGDTVAGMGRELRDRVAFVGLFGDPKLSLPEGRGIFPVGCRGTSLSPWRRGTASCYTDNGILDARTPYVPADLANRTGSWCDRDDPICNSNLADFLRSTHGRYAGPGRAVDQAAREAAEAVRGLLGDRGRGIDVAVDRAADAPTAPGDPAPSAEPPPTPQPPTASGGGTPAADGDGPTASGAGTPAAGGDRPAASGSVASIAPEAPTETGPPTRATPTPKPPRGATASTLLLDEYWTRPGSAVTFAVAGVPGATYRWDFDGDGAVDRATRRPVVEHRYPEPFTGRVRVGVEAADGAQLLTSAAVHVDRVGLGRRLPSGPSAVTVRAAYGPDGAIVRWTPGATTGRVDAWRVHDATGRLLAHVPGSARQADLPGLPDRSTALTVEAVNEFGGSAPAVAVPRGAGSSRFTAVPTGQRAAGGRPNRAVAAPRAADADPELESGLVATAAALLLATAGTLLTLGVRPRRGGRHRRSRGF